MVFLGRIVNMLLVWIVCVSWMFFSFLMVLLSWCVIVFVWLVVWCYRLLFSSVSSWVEMKRIFEVSCMVCLCR